MILRDLDRGRLMIMHENRQNEGQKHLEHDVRHLAKEAKAYIMRLIAKTTRAKCRTQKYGTLALGTCRSAMVYSRYTMARMPMFSVNVIPFKNSSVFIYVW